MKLIESSMNLYNLMYVFQELTQLSLNESGLTLSHFKLSFFIPSTVFMIHFPHSIISDHILVLLEYLYIILL